MPIFIISRLKKRIAQRNLLNPPHIWVIRKIRIDIKEHRHIHRLPSIQPLLLEAKTLNLREILRHLSRRHAIRRHPNDILIRLICRGIERQCSLTRQDFHLALLRREFPGQDVGYGAVESYADAFGIRDGLEALRGVITFRPAVAGGFYGLAAPACCLAYHLVHGHGTVGKGYSA